MAEGTGGRRRAGGGRGELKDDAGEDTFKVGGGVCAWVCFSSGGAHRSYDSRPAKGSGRSSGTGDTDAHERCQDEVSAAL